MIQLIQSTEKLDKNLIQKEAQNFQQLKKRTDLGFLQLPSRKALWDSSLARANEIKSSCKRAVVLGIGGSSLGPRTIQACVGQKSTFPVDYFENVDSLEFFRRLETLGDLSKVHWIVISKSGNTMETLSQTAFVNQHLKSLGIEMTKQTTVISEPKSNPLTDWAKQNQVPCLEIPFDVGGRFSVLCPVGLLPAALLGVSLDELNKGAAWALEQETLVASLAAHTLQSFKDEKWLTLFWFYSDQLPTLGAWIQQLWAESLAKNPGPRVSTPIPLLGTNDQHSILQQVMEGARDKFVWFFRIKAAETTGPTLAAPLFAGLEFMQNRKMGELLTAEMTATQMALQEVGVPSLTIEIETLDARSCGALLMLFELVVGTLGEALQINAYNQPGVELGKRLARNLLSK